MTPSRPGGVNAVNEPIPSASSRAQDGCPGFTGGGFTLIEVVLVIVIFAVASIGILSSFRINIMGATSVRVNTVAARLAQQRMEIILIQRKVNGFAGFADPCPAAAVCGTLPADYAITTPTVAVIDANTREITVTVTHNGSVRARLVTRVTNYL